MPSDRFVDLLKLRGQQFGNTSIDGILISVHDFASDVWQAPMLYKYVDHGIEHSYRVIEIALDILKKILPENVVLSEIERLVLGIAALLHDIGMQYNKYPQDAKQKPDDEIRGNHCDLGYEMVKDVIKGTFHQRGGPILSLEDHHKMFVDYGAKVGFSHGGTRFWEVLRDPTYADRKTGGLQIFRPRLLAAVLRLADELHVEYSRLQELNWLSTSLLTSEQKAHWTACYYTEELKVSSPGAGSLRIKMKWRVPENATDQDVLLIRTLLEDLRQSKATAEFDLVREFLKWKEGMEDCLFEYTMDPVPERAPIQLLPTEVAEFVTSKLRPYQFGQKTLPYPAGAKALPGSIEVDKLKNRAQTFFLSGEGTLRGHYRLRTGWHTNCYVRCRNLASDLDFVMSLSQVLAKQYITEDLSNIISVGTSAAKIGSLLSLLLGVRHQFTFADVEIKAELAGRRDYTEYERVVVIPPKARVLVIDDILGRGNIIEKISHQFANYAEPPEYLKVFCLYALGDLSDASEELSRVKIDYLVAFPDVTYMKEDPHTRTCEICKQKPYIAHDE